MNRGKFETMGEMSSTAKVEMLEGVNNYEEWQLSLKRVFLNLGLTVFLEHGADLASVDEFDDIKTWDYQRALAKSIIKHSVIRMNGPMMDCGWNPKSKNPKDHFKAAVRAIKKEAAESGLTSSMIMEMCRIDRVDFDTLAAYQNRLKYLKNHIGGIEHPPRDKFWLWVAINGLRKSNRRWFHQLEREVATGNLTWNGLMREMWSKAIKEHVPKTDYEVDQTDGTPSKLPKVEAADSKMKDS